MFPVSNKAQDVVDALIHTLQQNKVEVKEEATVASISYTDNQTFQVSLNDQQSFESQSLVMQLVVQVCHKQVLLGMVINLQNN